jgi:hypothetical protein
MDTRLPRSFVVAAVLTGLMVLPTLISAQFSHLVCAKIKDPAPRAAYQIGLNEVLPCILEAPAKMACHRVFKSFVDPQPPGGGPIGDLNVGKFLCYRIKCNPAAPGGSGSFNDQFGSRIIEEGNVKLLCAPASPGGAFLDGAPSGS